MTLAKPRSNGCGKSFARTLVSMRGKYREPTEYEVRRSGYALYTVGAHVVRLPSCSTCAEVLRIPWAADLFEGTCQGCEVSLSGLVDE